MAYITPNTTVHLLQGIRLDPSYAHTIYFETEVAQSTYFLSKVKYTFNNQTYQRIEENVIRVEKPEADVMDCSYLMFRNTSYKNKWFYAFITGTEYVNDITTNVYYEIDLVQTWLKEMTVMPCTIDRTHIPSADDVVGANITPENVNVGEYVHKNQNVLLNLHEKVVAIQVILDTNQPVLSMGGPYDGVYSGAKIWIKRLSETPTQSDYLAIYNFLSNFAQKPDNVLGIYMLPAWCVNQYSSVDADYIPFDQGQNIYVVGGGQCTGLEDFGKLKPSDLTPFVPKNKKLYTYPFNFHEFLTNDGQTMKMRYEFCKDKTARVGVSNCVTTPIQIVARPIDYKGVERVDGHSDYIYEDYEEHINVTNFPLCSWSNDYYASWVAQNGLPMAAGMASTALGMYSMFTNLSKEAVLSDAGKVTQSKIKHFMDLDPANPKHQKWFSQLPERKYTNQEVLAEGAPNIVSALQQSYQASIHADGFRGTLNTGNADWSTNSMNLYQRRTCVTPEYAKMIDDYFEKYGYNVGEIGYVSRNTRPHWTYVKTQDCKIYGNCPSSAIKFVESLYNRGMTWWANGDEVGDYSLNNH